MKISNLRKLPPDLAHVVTDANEALVDALLNLTLQRCIGSGAEGATVFGAKPSLRFVSGFLLPRFEESGQEDETSDIHISTHGLDCQIANPASGTLSANCSFSIYVRVLPRWEELTNAALDIFPKSPVRRELEQQIRQAVRDQLPALRNAEAEKADGQRRPVREIQQALFRGLLAEHGIRLTSGALISDHEEELGDTSATENIEPAEPNGSGHLAVQQGSYFFENDGAAQAVDIPQKWQRLDVTVDSFSCDLTESNQLAQSAADWSAAMRETVQQTVVDWMATPEGRDWAYRPATILPSNFRDETSWLTFLTHLRQQSPTVQNILPNLDGLALAVSVETDLRDSSRQNLRVILENNSNEVRKRFRERFDHSIFQVQLAVDVPVSSHRPLKLDRVEASYRFREFLSYPAIGINCGISANRLGDMLRLTTSWMPRYQQPRIVPNELPHLPNSFRDLSADAFDPSLLRPFTEAYRQWIYSQKTTLDPTVGADDPTSAARETERFRQDIDQYEREVQRVSLGIDLLEHSYQAFRASEESRDSLPYRAWILLNQTFARAGEERGIQGWRLFQLAFILAHVPTVASRMEEYAKSPWFDPEFDEETATLLYFPTGGGKSEAFFGLLIFTLFLDRLRGKHVGISALIRYPLRLLTLQQAQRLFAILIRAELVRREAGVKGHTFEIGFWVGSGNTPNRTNDPRLDPVPHLPRSNDNDDDYSQAYKEVNTSFNKVPTCPLCKYRTGLRKVGVGNGEETAIVCFNSKCAWNIATTSSPLPFLIVDSDIYRHAPAVLLGVIDKLALIGQHPSTINRIVGMFGLARWQEHGSERLVMPTRQMLSDGYATHGCEPLAPAYSDGVEVFVDPFPSLIIQDEAHLLEESLGTFAGLFETTLEHLLLRASILLKDRVARSPFGTRPPRMPKVIAATATVSVPQQQFGALYQRRHMHFPYPGTSIYRSFYAGPAEPNAIGRKGLGKGSPLSPEIEAPWMRTYAAIMTNGRNHTVTTVTVLAAYHLAITELWHDLNSQERRVLAVDRLKGALSANSPLMSFHAHALDVCGRGDPAVLLSLLDLMRISLTYVTNKKGGDQVIDAFRDEVVKMHRSHGRHLPQLHPRLISGGVDVAEIQEIMWEAEGMSRPGDDFPELEQSLRSVVATSAISHGVDVDKFNAMFFAGMPNDIAEFIQASSRVGRTRVGFSLLIPTPHARRDRYIVETHDVFHRFLERMIAPPAITRWAASAHDRVLTSLFQCWLSGWIEQKLFAEKTSAEKHRALRFETVNDVNRLLTGTELPGAAKDFMEFAVSAIGIAGRGVNRVGSAPHSEFYEDRLRNLAKQLTDEFRVNLATTKLADYWKNSPVGQPPMTSLRDIDEAGRFVPSRPFGTARRNADDEDQLLKTALRVVRRQVGRVGELDSEQGEE